MTTDLLSTGREAFGQLVLDKMEGLILGALDSETERSAFKLLWHLLSPAAIEQAVVQAPSLTVVDERTPGAPSSVELVDERTPETTTPRG